MPHMFNRTFRAQPLTFRDGVRASATSVFGLVLVGTYVGIGALAHDYGFSVALGDALDLAGLGRPGAGDPDLGARRAAPPMWRSRSRSG